LNQNLGRAGRCERDHEQCEREQASGFHGGIIAKSGATAPVVREINPGLIEPALAYPGLAQNA
jgi:hypothetical protein